MCVYKNIFTEPCRYLTLQAPRRRLPTSMMTRDILLKSAIYFRSYFFWYGLGILLDSCFSAVPASLLFCFVFLAFCFSCPSCFSAFPASLLFLLLFFLLLFFPAFCFSCFSAFLLFFFCAFLLLLFLFPQSCVVVALLLLAPLLLCFSASFLYCLFAFLFLVLYSLLFVSSMKTPRETQDETERQPDKNPNKKPYINALNETLQIPKMTP